MELLDDNGIKSCQLWVRINIKSSICLLPPSADPGLAQFTTTTSAWPTISKDKPTFTRKYVELPIQGKMSSHDLKIRFHFLSPCLFCYFRVFAGWSTWCCKKCHMASGFKSLFCSFRMFAGWSGLTINAILLPVVMTTYWPFGALILPSLPQSIPSLNIRFVYTSHKI